MHLGTLDDYTPVARLYQSVNGTGDGCSAAHHGWLCGGSPAGRAIEGRAEVADEIVGYYALVPVRLWLDGREVVAGLGVTALTRRDWQGRGIFLRVLGRVHEAAAAKGITVTYAVPSPDAGPWYRTKLGFTEVGQMSLWGRPLRVAPLIGAMAGTRHVRVARLAGAALDRLLVPVLGARRARSSPSGLEIREVETFDGDFDALWERVKRHYRFALVRCSAHLAWRYLQCPTRRYRAWGAYDRGTLVAYVVARQRILPHRPGLVAGVIADLFGDPDAIGGRAGCVLVSHALAWMAANQTCVCLAEGVLPLVAPALRRNGLFRVPRRLVGDRSLFVRGPVSASEAFHFIGGDHDVG